MKTKVIVLISIILFCGISELQAQKRFGIKAGMDRSNVRYYHPYSISRYGFVIGGLGYFPLNNAESLYLQPEVIYMQHGEKNIGQYANGVDVDEKYYINYMAVPILLKAYLSDHYNTFYVEGGPQFAFKISQKSSTNLDQIQAIQDYGEDGDKVALFDLSLAFGIGFSYERQWELGARYNYGLSDVYPDAKGENRANSNNAHTFTVGLHYIFD